MDKNMIKKTLTLSIFLSVLASFAKAEDHSVVAKFVPTDTAMLGSFQYPADTVQNFLEACGSDETQLGEVLDLILLTDPTDGTERRKSAETDVISFLANTTSCHLAVLNSTNELGDFALLFDRSDSDCKISNEFASLLIQVVAQFAKRRITPYSDNQFHTYLTRAQNNLTAAEHANWLVIGTSEDCVSEIMSSIKKGRKTSLANNRSFQASCNSSLKNSNCEFYVSFRSCKSFLIALGFENEKGWERKAMDEVPWQSYSAKIDQNGDDFYFDWKQMSAATMPRTGDSKLWEHYTEITEFPPLTDDAVLVRGKGVELEKWHAQSKLNYQETYGDKAYATYESNPLIAFQTGISRPKLGGMQFDYWDGTYQPGQLVLYKIDESADRDEILNYLEIYYREVERQSQDELRVDYNLTGIKGVDAWWSDIFEDNVATESDSPQFSDVESGEVENEAPHEASESEVNIEELKKDPSCWLQGDGAAVLDRWVAIGSRRKVDGIVDWDQQRLRDDESAQKLKSEILTIHSRFGENRRPHIFEFKRGRAIQEDLSEFSELVHQTMPQGWVMRQSDYQNMKSNLDLVPEYSRPVQLRFHLQQMVDHFCRNAKLVKVECFSNDMSKKVVGQTIILSQSDSEE